MNAEEFRTLVIEEVAEFCGGSPDPHDERIDDSTLFPVDFDFTRLIEIADSAGAKSTVPRYKPQTIGEFLQLFKFSS